MFPQQQHSRRSNRHRTYVEEQSPCETGPADDGDNQFQPTVSDTFTTYRDRAGRERGDGDDESEDDVVVTPIPRRSRVRRTNSLLSIEFTEMGQQIGTLRSVRPQLGAEFGKRRHSDAMVSWARHAGL
ncbi:hypothetical protein BC832DRAFT_435317 [Gaertneriomyces semiglobifer]|nr:hypothetical protein BC832DRAFT_435317 [Gaertneriomyces semiglobifer]